MFVAMVKANPHLRPRVGNPDEMRSNRLLQTLETLKFRVTDPEPGIPESVQGNVITALNEEAVASAALANKGGVNLDPHLRGVRSQNAWRGSPGNHLCQELRQGWTGAELALSASCNDVPHLGERQERAVASSPELR
jgi:hypothetical protein